MFTLSILILENPEIFYLHMRVSVFGKIEFILAVTHLFESGLKTAEILLL
jgi:hypothetical protein